MLSLKTMGWSLIAGFVTLVILFGAGILEGNYDTKAEEIAWLATNKDWQWLVPITMIAGLTMLIFTTGMISWIRSIDESNAALPYANYLPLSSKFPEKSGGVEVLRNDP